jgi:hypothetical protein
MRAGGPSGGRLQRAYWIILDIGCYITSAPGSREQREAAVAKQPTARPGASGDICLVLLRY